MFKLVFIALLGVQVESLLYCSPGQFLPGGSSSCVSCYPGTYSPGGTMGGCIPCNPGTFAPGFSSTQCMHCDPNTYARSSGQNICYACAAGFTSLSSSSSCTSVAQSSLRPNVSPIRPNVKSHPLRPPITKSPRPNPLRPPVPHNFTHINCSGGASNHSQNSFSCENQKVHINKLTLEDDSHVYIRNKSSFKSIDISKNSYLNLLDCEITCSSAILNGTLETSGKVSIVDSTFIFEPGSSLSNNGTIVLDNSTFIIDTSILLTDETSIISLGPSSIIVYGTIETDGNVTISAPIILNNTASMILNPNSTVMVVDVILLGTIKVLSLSTLVVTGTFILDTTTLPMRRKLLQLTSDTGSCIFNNAVLSGTGILDCNVIFSSDIIVSGVINIKSLLIHPSSSLVINLEHDVSIISQDDITIGGELQVVFIPIKSVNFTILYTQYGTISGTFSNIIFSSLPVQFKQTVLYTDNSVILIITPSILTVVVPKPPQSPSKHIIIAVTTISLFCLAVGLIYLRKRNLQNQKQHQKQQQMMFISSNEYSSCINPLV